VRSSPAVARRVEVAETRSSSIDGLWAPARSVQHNPPDWHAPRRLTHHGRNQAEDRGHRGRGAPAGRPPAVSKEARTSFAAKYDTTLCRWPRRRRTRLPRGIWACSRRAPGACGIQQAATSIISYAAPGRVSDSMNAGSARTAWQSCSSMIATAWLPAARPMHDAPPLPHRPRSQS
jgi:hypothetical protein